MKNTVWGYSLFSVLVFLIFRGYNLSTEGITPMETNSIGSNGTASMIGINLWRAK